MAQPESLSDCLDEVARFRNVDIMPQNYERFAQQKDIIEFIQNWIGNNREY